MSRTFHRNPLTAGRVLDGVAFVVTADDNTLHTLNATGTALWVLAGGEGLTFESATQALTEEFDVERDCALIDVEECVALFIEKGLLVEG